MPWYLQPNYNLISNLPEKIERRSNEHGTEEEKWSKAQLMKREILHTGDDWEKNQGEYLGHIECAVEEGQLLHIANPPEHLLHVSVVHLADQQTGGGV